MEKVRFFTDMHVWKKGHELALMIYQVTKPFPSEEKFGLVSQMRRSAVSITSNIAEGFGRRGIADKIRFYDMAMGSLYELQNQLLIARDLKLIQTSVFETCDNLTQEIRRMLISWISSMP